MQIFADWAAQYGPVYKWNLVGVDLLVVSDPQEIAKLTSREANIPKTAMMYKMMNNVSWVVSLHIPARLLCLHCSVL